MNQQAHHVNLSTPGASTSGGFNPAAFLVRVKDVLMNPSGCWGAITAESLTIKDIYLKYFLALAAIGPVCTFLGSVVWGGDQVQGTVSQLFVVNLAQYGFALIMAYLMAMVFEKLAPRSGGRGDRVAGLKLYVFALVPSAISGIFMLIPVLSILALLLGLYSVYVFWQGIGPMLSIPADRKLGFTAMAVVAWIVISIISMVVFLPLFAVSAGAPGL